jgi:type II secretory pathway pseudopilin PulG
VSLLELVIAIALMGTVVVGVLVSLRTTTRASRIDRDSAKAFEWLQAAADRVYNGARVPCYTTSPATPQAAYTALVQGANRPAGWDVASGATIQVTAVAFLGRTLETQPLAWSPASSHCFESAGCPTDLDTLPQPVPTNLQYCKSPLTTQKITITATGPDGLIVQTLEMVKSE